MMPNAGEEASPYEFDISEDFLMDNFIQPFINKPQDEDDNVDPMIDPRKLEFSETVFDKHYYKEKFPLLDDSVCDILEKCSIEKARQQLAPIEEEKPGAKVKKGCVEFSRIKTTVEFN
jgi:hypothetical protein